MFNTMFNTKGRIELDTKDYRNLNFYGIGVPNTDTKGDDLIHPWGVMVNPPILYNWRKNELKYT